MGALEIMKAGEKGKKDNGSYFTDKGSSNGGNGNRKPKPRLSFFQKVKKGVIKKEIKQSYKDVKNRDKWKDLNKKRFKTNRPEDKKIKEYYQGWKKPRPTGLKTLNKAAKRYGSQSDVARGFGKRYASRLPRRQPYNENERGHVRTVTRYSDGRRTVRTTSYKPRKQNNNSFGKGYSYNFFDTSLV